MSLDTFCVLISNFVKNNAQYAPDTHLKELVYVISRFCRYLNEKHTIPFCILLRRFLQQPKHNIIKTFNIYYSE
jgi:hypothetical protein